MLHVAFKLLLDYGGNYGGKTAETGGLWVLHDLTNDFLEAILMFVDRRVDLCA